MCVNVVFYKVGDLMKRNQQGYEKINLTYISKPPVDGIFRAII